MMPYGQSAMPPLGSWVCYPWYLANRCLRESAANNRASELKYSFWQFVFLQSRANGGFYKIDNLPQAYWQWPKQTWLQKRLQANLHPPETLVDPSNGGSNIKPRAPIAKPIAQVLCDASHPL